jgi:hypothetical protein
MTHAAANQEAAEATHFPTEEELTAAIESAVDTANAFDENAVQSTKDKKHLSAAHKKIDELIKRASGWLAKYEAATDATKKVAHATRVLQAVSKAKEEACERRKKMEEWCVEGFGGGTPPTPTPAGAAIRPRPTPRVFKPDVSCPLQILPQRKDLQAEVDKALDKTRDAPKLALRQVEATIVSFINRACVHITGVDPRVMFAVTDVVQLSQGKSKSCFKYCDFPANATGLSQLRAHWGTMELGNLEQRLVEVYAAKGGTRRDAERRAGADVKHVSRAGELWLEHPQHRVATQGEFAPPADFRKPATLDESVFNLYSGPGISYEESKMGGGSASGPGAVGFLLYLKEMFPPTSKGGDKTLDAFLYWAAQLVQCPGIKVPISPVMRGNKGCGKTACVTLIQFVVGLKYCSTPMHEKGVSGEFATTKGKLLVFADETGFAGDHQAQKTMKKMASSTVSSGRNLYERESTYMNFCRLACATNERQAVRLDDDEGAERRWLLVECRGNRRDLSHLFTEEAVRDIAAFLYEYKLKPEHGNPDRFMDTDASAHQLIEAKFGSKDLLGFLLSMLTHQTSLFPSEMTSEGIYNLYTTWADHVRVHANQRLAKGVLCRELKSVFDWPWCGAPSTLFPCLLSHTS